MPNIKKSLKIALILALACISVLLMTFTASADVINPDLPSSNVTLTYYVTYNCGDYNIKGYRSTVGFMAVVDNFLDFFNDLATANLTEYTAESVKFYLDTKYDIIIPSQLASPILNLYNSIKPVYEDIFRVARSVGYDEGLNDGYGEGYSDGTQNGLKEGQALQNGIKTIFSAPIYIITEVLDFEILGFSIYKFILSIITIFLFGYIVKTVIGFF